MKEYTETRTNLSSWRELTADYQVFSTVLSDWLFHSSGSGNKPNFRFDGNLSCDSPAPKILVILVFSIKLDSSKFSWLFSGDEAEVRLPVV